MKIKVISILIALFIPLLFCCYKHKETAPFFDGLYLEYDVKGTPFIYEITALDDNNFKIIETEKWQVFGDEIEEYYVNEYGRVYKHLKIKKDGTKKKKNKLTYSPIWIPVHKIEIGDKLGSGYTAIRKDKWKEWDVLVIQHHLGLEKYFELEKGFLVGYKVTAGRRLVVYLTDTNVDIPVFKK